MSASGEDTGKSENLVRLTNRQMAVALIRPFMAGVILLFGYFLLPINQESSWNVAGFICGTALLVAFCWWEVREFIASKYPVAKALEMLMALATFYLIAFATAYFIFSEYAPGSFNEKLTRIDSLYFCLTVFTTTGFGDIAPDSQFARSAVSIQMASTFILIGLGLRFLNTLVTARAKHR